MKRLTLLVAFGSALAMLLVSCENALNPAESQALGLIGTAGGDVSLAKKNNCVTIQGGTLLTSAGDDMVLGYDQWGYNYQAHLFNGTYCDVYRDAAWCQEYKDIRLVMKWNDAWLSNKDCDDDGLLDRHLGYSSYIGSGAWETNEQSGTCTDDEGNTHHWTYFVKIVAVPADAVLVDGTWNNAAGTEIGPSIWGQFAIIQEVNNDPCAGVHGIAYLSPDHAGFGNW